MSGLRNSVVLGYHGCSAEAAERILRGEDVTHSVSEYDWLGPGAYFWEADPVRGLEWAVERANRGTYAEPCVIGAVIDLGHCLDLTVRENANLLSAAYVAFEETRKRGGLDLPRNQDVGKSTDAPLRYLDNAVITFLHEMIEEEARDLRGQGRVPAVQPFDTVRGLFPEGAPLYPGGGIFAKTHTQLVVRNACNIKGVFRPRPYPLLSS